MRKVSKVAFLFFFTLVMIALVGQGTALAKSGIKVVLYGSIMQGEHLPVMKNNTVLVPFKEIFKTLGFSVSYDSVSKTISGDKSGTTIKLVIDQNTAWINNTPTTLQVAPQIINGATYVPLRVISEASGLEVKWYGESQIVSLYSKQNLFSASNGGKFGYINAQGKNVIDYQTKFTNAYPFSEGLAIVYSSGKFAGFINQQGKLVIPKGNYYDAKDFSEGLAAYRTLDPVSKYGYMDVTGASIIKPQFKKANSFSEGLAAVQIGSKYGYIDSLGKIIIKAQYDSAKDFSEGLALVTLHGAFFYIDKKGNVLIKADYSKADSFSEGLAAVKKGSEFGFINKKGKIAIPAIYEEAHSFSGGLAAVRVKGKTGYIDHKGTMIISNQFDAVSDFYEGLAAAESGGKTGFINKKGDWVIQPTLSWAQPFSNGLSYAYSDDGEVYINQTGQIVWRIKEP
ncbi:WG repeat-containing protein [Paenibacillus albidus]|uniref:WG repeat-containing protein n=1 Tax=Paenibacillus albidus TaxID=2041023 RepID=UPI001BEA3179|nr:WG repeat-containing protein [Paenibacillus albidus]MBT2287735.1 WG repeat-containing protein [Paenibacillus albidus]